MNINCAVRGRYKGGRKAKWEKKKQKKQNKETEQEKTNEAKNILKKRRNPNLQLCTLIHAGVSGAYA